MQVNSTTMTKQGRRFSQVMRCHHDEVCTIFDNVESSLLPLVLKFYEKGIIDERTKNEICHQSKRQGADIMMKYLRMKAENNPEIFQTVLELMGEVNVLQTVVPKIKDGIYVHEESEEGMGIITMHECIQY